jgi:hypothetical protein
MTGAERAKIQHASLIKERDHLLRGSFHTTEE